MRTHRALNLWVCLMMLAGCAIGTSMPQGLLAIGPHEDTLEVVAGGPRFRFPHIKSKPAEKPSEPQTPSSATRASSSLQPESPKPPPTQAILPKQSAPKNPALTRWLDPKVARTLFDEGMTEAKRIYPQLYGGPKQKHHVHPKYLGGIEEGPTVDLDPAYHQLITSAFRKEHKYGQRVPPPEQQEELLKRVYSRYPLPGIHF